MYSNTVYKLRFVNKLYHKINNRVSTRNTNGRKDTTVIKV